MQPFKVICINAKPLPNGVGFEPLLKEGKIYTVVYMDWGYDVYGNRALWYELAEVRRNPKGGWAAERFIMVSDIDEKKFVIEKIKNYDY